MPTLASELRNKLERVVVEARDAAEAGSRAALEAVAVHEPRFYRHMSEPQRELRNHLRARARQIGDRQDSTGRLAIDHLAGECAYEHWHRMLFARFLAENDLLIEPQGDMAISLAEAEELAKEDGVDLWVFASRCAQRMLPQIFRPDDPLLQVSFAAEHMLKLEGLVASLPQAVFAASDALGWVYQFWQSKKKDEVNRSEVKIGADELPAVTQLFTEPYMVHFLLHNTLGAWYAGNVLPALSADLSPVASAEGEALAKADEASLRKACALPGVEWEYLRFVREDEGRESCEAGQSDSDEPAKQGWRPAAGTFDGWPRAAAEVKVLDPCCGSGHFLVAALHHLVPIRMAEEGLSAREAVDAVLRDNLHGLEIDERCCQIAAFALAFAAWTYPEAGRHRPLPDLHIACTGIGPQATAEEWLKLAEQSGIPMPTVGREAIRNGLLNLHRLFSQAPTLGSLINPAELPSDLFAADYETIQPYLAAILKAETSDHETREWAIAAAGMAKAADLLADEYTLVITNVPYLGRGKQDDVLRASCDHRHPRAKADLATCFVERCLGLCAHRGTIGVVTQQHWWFQPSSASLRAWLLDRYSLSAIVTLGEEAWQSFGDRGPLAALLVASNESHAEQQVAAIDALPQKTIESKVHELLSGCVRVIHQSSLRNNPDARFALDSLDPSSLLGNVCESWQGLVTTDSARFMLAFWEVWGRGWEPFISSPTKSREFGGRENVVCWMNASGPLHREGKAHNFPPQSALGRKGVLVSQVRSLAATLYSGEVFAHGSSPVIPRDESMLPALWCFLSSGEYSAAVRNIDKKLAVTNRSLLKIEFDEERWNTVSAERYPNGLPEPESDDPTQWLFHGRPEESDAPLQVAVARMLGYRWPAELDDGMRLSERARALVKRCDELARFADEDGIVCIPSVRGEEPAAERLLVLLAATGIEPAKVRELAGGADLDDWLRNGFFEEHCRLFHNRPFVWHIWDGRKRDGFHALVSYHRLAEGDGKGRKLLELLTYACLGEWITRQKDGVKRGEGGAEDRLAAALELQKRLVAILEGEPPFDIFVRWKPLSRQPIGWEPDINDGVRLNIRPFLASDLPGGRTGAGVLRWKPNIKWRKDRGKEPERPKDEYPWFWGWDEKTEDFAGGKTFDGNRWNGCHYTNKARQQAREAAEGAKRG